MKSKFKAKKRMGGTDSLTGNIVLLSASQTHFGNEDSYYLIPATPAAYEAQVEAMAKAAWRSQCGPNVQDVNWKILAGASLAAFGIKKPAKGTP